MRRTWVVILNVVLLLAAPMAHAIMGVDVNEDIDSVLAGRAPPLHLAGARYRIAVFEFEDPNGTGLGSAVSSLIAREVLLRSGLQSIGVLNYYGSLEPSDRHPQSYFDKVDLVVRAQQASLAIWGVIRRDGNSLLVDVQAQLPDAVVEESFTGSLNLPEAMGGETLKARISPNRMRLGLVRLPIQFGTTLVTMARSNNTVRTAPSRDAPVATHVPKYSALSVSATRGDWSKVVVDGKSGWVQDPTECKRECAQLLSTASFVGALLKFAGGGPAPTVPRDLSRDIVVVARQLAVLGDLRSKSYQLPEVYLERWGGGRAGDYGAPYANLLALSAVAVELQRHGDQGYDQIRLDDTYLRRIATGLAQASQDDPRNVDVLDNLAILFRVLRDERRAGLAARLALEARQPRLAEPSR